MAMEVVLVGDDVDDTTVTVTVTVIVIVIVIVDVAGVAAFVVVFAASVGDADVVVVVAAGASPRCLATIPTILDPTKLPYQVMVAGLLSMPLQRPSLVSYLPLVGTVGAAFGHRVLHFRFLAYLRLKPA